MITVSYLLLAAAVSDAAVPNNYESIDISHIPMKICEIKTEINPLTLTNRPRRRLDSKISDSEKSVVGFFIGVFCLYYC